VLATSMLWKLSSQLVFTVRCGLLSLSANIMCNWVCWYAVFTWENVHTRPLYILLILSKCCSERLRATYHALKTADIKPAEGTPYCHRFRTQPSS
jgi:hypothetical protein